MTIVLYDKDNGNIVSTQDNTTITNPGATLINVPKDKILIKINEDGTPDFADRPMTIEERIALLEEQNVDQDDALVELSDAILNME